MSDHIPSLAYDVIGEFIAAYRRDDALDVEVTPTSYSLLNNGVTIRLARWLESHYETVGSYYFQSSSFSEAEKSAVTLRIYINNKCA